MATFTNPAYSTILVLQLVHLVTDLLINTASIIIATRSPIFLLILYLIQDIGLIFAGVLIFLIFFNTYAFKAGLLTLLITEFLSALVVSFVYFVLTFGLNAWVLSLQWQRPNSFIWGDLLQALYVVQKMLAVLYYYLYKRAALRLGDPKYYEDSDWLRKHVNTR